MSDPAEGTTSEHTSEGTPAPEPALPAQSSAPAPVDSDAPQRKPRKYRERPVHELDIDDFDAEGRGVARDPGGKVVFVSGALNGERVVAMQRKKRKAFDEASTEQVLRASEDRVEPRCQYFGTCGGCSLQHMAYDAQLAFKQANLERTLESIGHVRPARWLEPIAAEPWGYRRRARLGAKLVEPKDTVVVGFRERHAPYVTDSLSCDTLIETASRRIPALRETLYKMEARARIPQIEVAGAGERVAFVIRHLDPLSHADSDALRAFAKRSKTELWLQPGGPESVAPLGGSTPEPLSYRLPAHDITIQFAPNDFVQINDAVNIALVDKAIELLALEPDHRVLDLFCGIGNFSLAVARHCASVLGVEVSAEMTRRAAANARRNGLDNARFAPLDLQRANPLAALPPDAKETPFDAWLLDPPRSGALDVLQQLPTAGLGLPRRIVYVSCNPATLARDLALLVDTHGYTLQAAGLADMFPQTSHAEAICVLEKR